MKGINRLFITIIAIFLVIIIFTDNNKLNSLFINYNYVAKNDVAILNAEDNNKVIYKEQPAPVVTNSTPQNTQTISNIASSDYWEWPTEKNYTITTYYSSGHKAIDIYSYFGNGSNIYAANNGTVSMVRGGCRVGNLSCNGRGGNYIVINHNNGYYTVYMHLKDIRVREGDTVSRGQVIGTMGNTGNVEPVPTASSPYLGTHLHFCLYTGVPFNGGTPINPMRLY